MNEHASSATSPPQQAVQALVGLLRVLQRRARYPIVAVGVAVALGGLYYASAERVYESTALLQVIQSRADLLNQQQADGTTVQNLIPTHERLITCPVVIENALARIRTFDPSLRIDFADAKPEEEADVLRKSISASGIRQTDIIQATCRSKSPEASQALLGAVVEAYLEFNRANHKDVSTEVVGILKRERTAYAAQLRDKEAKLLQFKLAFGDLGLRSGSSATHPAVQRVLKLNEAYLSAQEERVRLESLSAAVAQAVSRGGDLGPYLLEIEPTVGREMLQRELGMNDLDMQTLAEIEQEILKDRARLENLKRHLGDSNPEIVELESSIAARSDYVASFQSRADERTSDATRERLARIVVSTLSDQLAKARAYEAQFAEAYADGERKAVALAGNLAKLEILEHEAANLRRLNDVMLDRIAALDIGQDKGTVRVETVGRPKAKPEPVWPKLYLVAAACLAVGFGTGAAMAYVHDLLDDRFRAPEEFEEQLGVPAMAIVRRLPASDELGADGLFVHVHPRSVESEAFRTLRTTLAFSKEERELLAITSSEPGDGKTTVLSNLAVAFAQAGKRTLMIDADMRRPGLSRFFEMRGLPGLSEILRGDEPVADVAAAFVTDSGVDDLDVIPCGSKPGNPSELLSGTRLQELLAWALGTYDQILIDCPPVLAGPDAAIVASHADGLLMVVTPHKNRRRVVLRAAAELRAMDSPLIGVVANQIDPRSGHGYYGYGYGYGYGYSEAYGSEETFDDESRVASQRIRRQPVAPATRLAAQSIPPAAPATKRRPVEVARSRSVIEDVDPAPRRASEEWPAGERAASAGGMTMANLVADRPTERRPTERGPMRGRRRSANLDSDGFRGSRRRKRSSALDLSIDLSVDRTIEWGLIGACLLIPTLFLGGLHPLGKALYVGLVATLALYQALANPYRDGAKTGLGAFWIAAMALVAIQLLPLPSELLAALGDGYDELLPAWNDGSAFGRWTTISLVPHGGKLGLSTLVAHALFFRCCAHALRERVDLERALTLAACLGFALASLGLAQYFLGNGKYLWLYDYPTRDAQDSVKAPFTNGNHFAHYLALCTGPWLWLAISAATGRRLPAFWRAKTKPRSEFGEGARPEAFVLTGAAGVVAIAAVLLTYSRGGVALFLVAATVAAGWYAWRRSVPWKLAVTGGAVFAATGVAIFILGGDRLVRELDTDQLSAWERLDPGFLRTRLWLSDLEAWKRFPLVGSGVGSHREIYPTFYAYWFPKEYRFAESGYVHVLVETGVVGLGLALAAVGTLAYKLFRAYPNSIAGDVQRRSHRSRSASTPIGHSVWGALAASLVVSVSHNAFDFGWYLPGCFSLSILLAVAICRAACIERSPADDPHRSTAIEGDVARPRQTPALSRNWPAFVGVGVLAWLGVTALLPEVRGSVAWDDYMRIAVRFEGRGMFDGSPDAATDEEASAMMSALRMRLAETPDDHRASVRLAGLCLHRFERRQLDSDNAFTLADLRQTLEQAGFADEAAKRRWLAKIVGPRQQLLDAAAVYARRAIRRSPLDGEAYVYLAAVGPFVDRDAPDVDVCFEQALAARPYDATTLLQAADHAARAGDEASATERLRTAYAIVPPARDRIVRTLGPVVPPSFFLDDLAADAEGCRQLATYYLAGKRTDEAAIAADRWFDLLAAGDAGVSNPLRSWTSLAEAYQTLQRTDRELDCLDRALAMAPDEYVLRRRRAFALIEVDRLDEADAELVRCLQTRPDDSHVQQQRRFVLDRQEQAVRRSAAAEPFSEAF